MEQMWMKGGISDLLDILVIDLLGEITMIGHFDVLDQKYFSITQIITFRWMVDLIGIQVENQKILEMLLLCRMHDEQKL